MMNGIAAGARTKSRRPTGRTEVIESDVVVKRSAERELPAPDVVVDAAVGIGEGLRAGESTPNEHCGRGVRRGERVGDDTSGAAVTRPVDQRSCRNGGEAAALPRGRDGVADLDVSFGGWSLEPAEADKGTVIVE